MNFVPGPKFPYGDEYFFSTESRNYPSRYEPHSDYDEAPYSFSETFFRSAMFLFFVMVTYSS